MKIAKSEGGPFIGISHDQLQHWSGIAGTRFVGERSTYSNDYQAAGTLVDGVSAPPCSIAKLSGLRGDALLLSMPFETAVIEADGRSAFLAQVHYADEDWSFLMLSTMDFKRADYDEHIPFSSEGGAFVFFDAAYPAEDVGENYVSFDLPRGHYVLSAALYYSDSRTLCTLYRVVPRGLHSGPLRYGSLHANA